MTCLFKISEASTLALHTMVFLGTQPGQVVSTKDIATRLQASENHLAKILQRLTRAGLVSAVRGPKGGFILDADTLTTSMLRVLEVIEGPLDEGGCLVDKAVCGDLSATLGAMLKRLNREAYAYLRSTTLGELAQQCIETHAGDGSGETPVVPSSQ